ncbi:hypothetical protein DB330_08210 [Lacticaseibacillus casei]|nr:hypothetical protein [Lacticaseibacillus casei]PTU90729.1 hypothetical protein DB326_13490 [Lacticaseibacillus casei]PTU94250.1 hypothetical protein DB330_08210 [Lacticaseibacillus casei]
MNVAIFLEKISTFFGQPGPDQLLIWKLIMIWLISCSKVVQKFVIKCYNQIAYRNEEGDIHA